MKKWQIEDDDDDNADDDDDNNNDEINELEGEWWISACACLYVHHTNGNSYTIWVEYRSNGINYD